MRGRNLSALVLAKFRSPTTLYRPWMPSRSFVEIACERGLSEQLEPLPERIEMSVDLKRRLRLSVPLGRWLKNVKPAVVNWRTLPVALLVGSIVWGSAIAAPTQPVPINQPAARASWAAKSLLLGVARAGQRMVAVGERGFVLLSDNNGRTWRQAATVPTSVTLTKVSFATPTEGWAVGHMGVVLHTIDGGNNWVKQLDGILAANLAYTDAKQKQQDAAGGDDAKKLQALVEDAESLVRDGPDKPFLSLLVIDANRVLALGAFGFAFATEDGGRSWLPIFDRVEDARGRHIYGLVGQDNSFYAVGEQGLFLRSRNGSRFEGLTTPFRGTLFGTLAMPGGPVLAYGLRGALLRSDDAGAHWTEVKSGVELSLTNGLVLADGRILLGSQSGKLIVSGDGGRRFFSFATAPQPIAGLAQAADGAIIVAGPRGIARIEMPQGEASK